MKTLPRLLTTLSALGLLALADGGSLILRKQAGPLEITLFGAPQPLRVSAADLSVMVQKISDKSAIMDADVKVRLKHSAPDGITEVFAPATHANATNKLLYAAHLNFPQAGVWTLAVIVEGKNGSAEVAGTVTVLPPKPPLLAYWPYFAVVPLIILLFIWNQWLRRGQRTSTHR